MRTDECGNPCPSTLGEYRDLVFAFVRDESNPAVKYLDERIAEQGRDMEVIAPDGQMRAVLFPLMLEGLRNGND